MANNLSCVNCKSLNSIEEESNHGEKQLVCVVCGLIVEAGNLITDTQLLTSVSNNSQYTDLNVKFLPKGISQYTNTTKSSKGLKAGLSIISALSSHYHLPHSMADEVRSLFKLAFASEYINSRAINFKEKLAAVCVYIKMRERAWPVTINNICYTMNCTKEEISAPMHSLSKHLNISFQSPPIEDMVESFHIGLRLEDEERKMLIEKTLAVLELCTDCWLLSGRSPRGCIFGATFLVWKSLSRERLKITPKTFCRLVNITYQHSIHAFIKELSKALVILGSKLPWLEVNEINIRNVSSYLDDILKYGTTLRLKVLEEMKREGSLRNLESEEMGYEIFRNSPKERPKSEPLNPNISFEICDKEIESYICTKSEVLFKENLV